MRSMREHHGRLDSVREENLAIGTINSQLRQRIEAMEAKKREAIEQWEIERGLLRQELTRVQAGEARYRPQVQREEGEVRDTSRVSGASNRMASNTTGVSRGLLGEATSGGEQTPFAGNREHQDTATAQRAPGKQCTDDTERRSDPPSGSNWIRSRRRCRVPHNDSSSTINDHGEISFPQRSADPQGSGQNMDRERASATGDQHLRSSDPTSHHRPKGHDGYKNKDSDFEDTTRKSQQRLAARVGHGDLPEGARGGVR